MHHETDSHETDYRKVRPHKAGFDRSDLDEAESLKVRHHKADSHKADYLKVRPREAGSCKAE